MSLVRMLSSQDLAVLPDLCALLIDSVEGGASIGFLKPLQWEVATHYWHQVLACHPHELCVWVAEDCGQIVGSVQLALCQKENGRHRAEVQKLLVLRTHRGRGLARALMQAVEAQAWALGRRLLVLDTQKGSVAETVYQRLGWQKAGEIPDFAASPDGVLQPTVLYFKPRA